MLVKPLVRPIVRAIAGNPTASLGSGFSPTSLFLDGSKGVLYDNNDLSSFYLDAAGTTAATVNGLVGLQLDKSIVGISARRNLASYTEAFANAYWNKVTVSLASATAPDGTSTATTMTATAGPGDRIERNGIIAGATGTHTYSLYIKRGNTDLVQISLRNSTTATDLAVSLFDVNAGTVSSVITGTSAIESIGSGWYRCSVTSSGGVTAGNSLRLYAYCGTSSATIGHTATIWGAQLEAGTTPSTYQKVVQEEGGWMPGNHRYQATTGSKPVLRGTPTGASLVTNGDFASGTGWTAGAGWAIGSGVATATAATGLLNSGNAVTPGKVYRVTITVTSFTSGSLQIRLGNTNATFFNQVGTCVVYVTATDARGLDLVPTTLTAVVDNIEVVDVSAGSVTAPYGLQYDGVDDFMQTAALDFTATDKMFVCVGIQRGITTSLNMVVESSTGGGAGSFYIAAPYNATSEAAFVLNGTATGGYSVDNLSTTAPPREVYSTQYDIGAALLADEIKPRINGLTPTLSVLAAGPAGTGNFGNYAMYFGRRAGTSFPLNGLDFGMVICGKTLTSTQITQTERYIAQRTGVTI